MACSRVLMTTEKSKHLSVGGTVPERFARTGSSVPRVRGI